MTINIKKNQIEINSVSIQLQCLQLKKYDVIVNIRAKMACFHIFTSLSNEK